MSFDIPMADIFRAARPLLTRSMFPVWLLGFLLTLDAVLGNGFGAANRLRTILSLAVLFSIALMYVSGWVEDPAPLIAKGTSCFFALAIISDLAANHFFPPPRIYSGPLLEAGDESPAQLCGAKTRRGDLGIYSGQDEVLGRGTGSLGPVFIGACSAMTLDRTARGLLVNAFGYDSSGNIAWRVYRNNFTLMSGALVTPDGFHFGQVITMDRTNKSALRLVDDMGQEIFTVRYLNRNAVQISSAVDCGSMYQVPVRSAVLDGGRRRPSCRVIEAQTDE